MGDGQCLSGQLKGLRQRLIVVKLETNHSSNLKSNLVIVTYQSSKL
jgi:hypothetical protein